MTNINWPGWETVELIGRGSFGAVYEIQRKLFDETEKAALKVISIPQNSSDIEEMYNDGYDDESITSTFRSHLQNIVAEYSLMRKMNGSANIVNCDDVRYIQHDDGFGWDIFIKMELLTPLAKAIPQNPSEETVVRIAKDMCAALELCKKYDIVHRDIKPQNIFVSPNGDYKLGDFGIAKTVEKTMGGTKVGTYKYMAPEVYHNQPYGSGADIYSLGLVLYWLLNERRMPFMPLPPQKMRSGMEEKSRYRRMNGEKLPEPKHGSDKLKAIVLKACAFDPKDRYQSAAEMKQALEMLGKAEEKPVESAVVIDMLTEDDATMGAWAPAVKTPPVIETVPVTEPVVEDEPVLDDEDTVIPTKNEDKTVGMWVAIEAERERKRKEAEEADRRRIEAEQKRLAEEAAEKERQRLLEEQRIRDEEAAELKRQKELEEKKKRDAEEAERIRKLAEEKKKKLKKLLPILLLCILLIGMGVFQLGGGRNNVNDDFIANPTYDITEVSGGNYHILGVKYDGTVVSIGENTYGRCDVSDWHNIVDVSVGDFHSVGLKNDGTVVACGLSTEGRLDVHEWADIIQIATGSDHTVGLKENGTVVATGFNDYEQCNVDQWNDVVQVCATKHLTLGLKKNGEVVAVGQLSPELEKEVKALKDVVSIDATCGYYSEDSYKIAVLKSDGQVIVLGDEKFEDRYEEWTAVKDVAVCSFYIMGCKVDGTVHVDNTVGDNPLSYGFDATEWPYVISVESGPEYILAVTPGGCVLHFGNWLRS